MNRKNKVEIYLKRKWEFSSKHGDLEIAIINAETLSARGKPVRVKDVNGKIVWTGKEGK